LLPSAGGPAALLDDGGSERLWFRVFLARIVGDLVVEILILCTGSPQLQQIVWVSTAARPVVAFLKQCIEIRRKRHAWRHEDAMKEASTPCRPLFIRNESRQMLAER
jgi:hypothetical protein